MSTPSTITSISKLFAIAHHFADQEGTALLYSGGDHDSAHTSTLFLFPYEKITLSAAPGCWNRLKKALGSTPDAVGYLGYEMGCFADPDREIPYLSPQTPDALFYRSALIIRFDHRTQKTTIIAQKDKIPKPYRSLDWIHDLKLPPIAPTSPLKQVYASDTPESYLDKITKIKELILDGELYQVNLSQEFHFAGKTDPFAYFRQVTKINPAPFSAYLNCGEFTIVSSSPERFLKKENDQLETRPIKGTSPRRANPKKDQASRDYLQNSEKERAELLMTTDLMRNDLSRVSRPKTVQTEALWQLETYTNVYHLLSIIKGRVEPHSHPIDILRAIFPGGSISGCPKLRAMEAIFEFEKRPRGIYTGSIGYFDGCGNFDFNIAIRTLVVYPNKVQIQLGGAIVIDSDPVSEYEETLYKGRSLFTALGAEDLVI